MFMSRAVKALCTGISSAESLLLSKRGYKADTHLPSRATSTISGVRIGRRVSNMKCAPSRQPAKTFKNISRFHSFVVFQYAETYVFGTQNQPWGLGVPDPAEYWGLLGLPP